MAGNKFYGNTELLNEVANDIQSLLEKINNDDASKGTYTQFKEASSIDGPTKTFWDGPNALAKAYANEYKYVCDTYDALIQQLKNVQQACQQTAAKYKSHEDNAKTDVSSPKTQYPGSPSGSPGRELAT
jgi:uncharacterized protein YukE